MLLVNSEQWPSQNCSLPVAIHIGIAELAKFHHLLWLWVVMICFLLTVASLCEYDDCENPEENDWVMCKSCNSWFHCLCVELTIEQAKREDFLCSDCNV